MQSTATLSLSETLVQNRLTAKAKSGTPNGGPQAENFTE